MMAVALLGAGFPVHAQTSAKDSLKVINLQEVQVVSTRAMRDQASAIRLFVYEALTARVSTSL